MLEITCHGPNIIFKHTYDTERNVKDNPQNVQLIQVLRHVKNMLIIKLIGTFCVLVFCMHCSVALVTVNLTI